MESALVSSVPGLPLAAQDLAARANAMAASPDTALTLLAADALITLSCEMECRSRIADV